jgi:hypothetical protein
MAEPPSAFRCRALATSASIGGLSWGLNSWGSLRVRPLLLFCSRTSTGEACRGVGGFESSHRLHRQALAQSRQCGFDLVDTAFVAH